MKLQNQCCTRQQGERLEELGVKGTPMFCHCYVSVDSENSTVAILPTGFELNIPDLGTTWIAPAFTVAELGVMLPTGYDTMRISTKVEATMWQGYDLEGNEFTEEPFNTEAECRAAMLINLIETEAVTVEEVNARLCAE